MTVDRLEGWIEEYSRPEYVWYVKRLSGNDTLANGAHQAGPYIPKAFLFSLFPVLTDSGTVNPRVSLTLAIDSHRDEKVVNIIWYNNKTRNETRITGFGGSSSAMLDPDNTGALVVFAFETRNSEGTGACHSWICGSSLEEDFIEEMIGPVEPSQARIWSAVRENQSSLFETQTSRRNSCVLSPNEIPVQWLSRFPTGEEIVQKAIELRADIGDTVDARLMSRRACEYEIFKSIEEAIELPKILEGFSTLEDFLGAAQSILQRRKSRSGRSLELHTRSIFLEEGFEEGISFSYLEQSEPGRTPDFIFPSASQYRDPSFPPEELRILAVKTTVKDRWRQILNEAQRVGTKHLLTLQEGVSEKQFQEMVDSRVRLVVPAGLFEKYPKVVQPHLMTLESFVGEVRILGH